MTPVKAADRPAAIACGDGRRAKRRARLGAPVAARDITWFDLQELTAYDLIVIGSSTWNVGQLPSDMKIRLPRLAELEAGARQPAEGAGQLLAEAGEAAGQRLRCGADDNQRRACAQPAGAAAPSS